MAAWRLFRSRRGEGARYVCPLCRYAGPFHDYHGASGVRVAAQCPGCGCLERHRLQLLVLEKLASSLDFSRMSALHFAPEPYLSKRLSQLFRSYTTSDLVMDNVDVRADMTSLPFPSCQFDLIFASHVLEHVSDDGAAIRETARVLNPGGVALLPVPIVSPGATVEYGAPNDLEDGHVRAPGLDYFERFRAAFGKITVFSSEDFPHEYQTFIHEDRKNSSQKRTPLRPPGGGSIHSDYVPVCWKAGNEQPSSVVSHIER